MLPSILKVAERYSVTLDKKTMGNKESRAKCPFCLEDANRHNKYFLSLNIESNVFKCWFCKKSGGVLKFESLLSGKSFQEVKESYFGKRKGNSHPAYNLSPEQLDKIGWRERKRMDFKSFNEERDEIMKEWQVYKFEQLTIYYALFILMANHSDKKRVHWSWLKEISKSSQIDGLEDLIVNQYRSTKKAKWAMVGKTLADIAYEISKESMDIEFSNLFANVLLALEIRKLKVKESNRATSSVS